MDAIIFNKEGKNVLSYDTYNELPLFRFDMARVSTHLLETYTFFVVFRDTTTRIVKAKFADDVTNFFLFELQIDENNEYEIIKSNASESSGRLTDNDTAYVHEIRVGFSSETAVNQYEYLEVYIDNVLSAYIEFYCESEELDDKFKNMAVDTLRFDFTPDDFKAIYSVDVKEDIPDNIVLNRKYKEFIFEYLNLVAHKTSYKSLINIIKFFDYGDRLNLKEYWENPNAGEGEIKYTYANLDENLNDINKKMKEGLIKTTFLGLFYNLNRLGGFDNDGNEQTELTSTFTIDEIITKLNYLKNYLDRSSFLPEPFEIVDIVGRFLSFHRTVHTFWSVYSHRTHVKTNRNKFSISVPSTHYLKMDDYNIISDPEYFVLDDSLAVVIENPSDGVEELYTTYQRRLCAITTTNLTLTSEYREVNVKLQRLESNNWINYISIEGKPLNEISNISFAITKSGKYRVLYVVDDYFSNRDFIEHSIEIIEHTPILRVGELVSDSSAIELSDERIRSLNNLVKTNVVANQLIYDSVNYKYANNILNESLGLSVFDMKDISVDNLKDKSPYMFGVHLATFRWDLYGDGSDGVRRLTIGDAISTETIEFREYDSINDGINYVYDALEILCQSTNRIFNQFNYSFEWFEKDQGTLIPVIFAVSKRFNTMRKFKFGDGLLHTQNIEHLVGSYPVCDIFDIDAGTYQVQIIHDDSVVYNNNITANDLDEFYDQLTNAYDNTLVFKMYDSNSETERLRFILPEGNELNIIAENLKGVKRCERIEAYNANILTKNLGDDYKRGDLVIAYIDENFLGDFYDINWELYRGQELVTQQNSLVFRYMIKQRGSYNLKITYSYKGDDFEIQKNGIFLCLV